MERHGLACPDHVAPLSSPAGGGRQVRDSAHCAPTRAHEGVLARALAAGVGATVFGIAALLQTIGHQPQTGNNDWSWIVIGFGERHGTLSAALGSLAIAWLLVAVGAGRTADRP